MVDIRWVLEMNSSEANGIQTHQNKRIEFLHIAQHDFQKRSNSFKVF